MGWGDQTYLEFLTQIKDKVSEKYSIFDVLLFPKVIVGDEAEIDRESSQLVYCRDYAFLLKAKQDRIIPSFKQKKKIKKVFKLIEANLDWAQFYNVLEDTHDRKYAINPWGIEKQKRFLKEKIKERCEKYNQITFDLTEKTFGSFKAPSGTSGIAFISYATDNPEIHIEFCKVIRALEKERFLELKSRIDVELNEIPTIISEPDWSLASNTSTYYPAEHCSVKVEISEYKTEFQFGLFKKYHKSIEQKPSSTKIVKTKRQERLLNEARRIIRSSSKIKFSPDLYNETTRKPKLLIFNKEIDLPKGKNEDYLCRVIFLKYAQKTEEELDEEELKKAKSGTKEWSWDEIKDISEGGISSKDEREPWRPVYSAVGRINKKIEDKTKNKEFFIRPTVSTVRINPDYLE